MKNQFEIKADHVVIHINSKKHGPKECLVDVDDFNRVKGMVWCLSNTGYASTNIGNKSSGFHSTILLHRLITSFPCGLVDHKNHNRLDNRKTNLRPCSMGENLMNTKARRTNKLGVKGICFTDNRYDVRVTVNKKSSRIGRYKTLEEAVAAHEEASLRIQGEFSVFNK